MASTYPSRVRFRPARLSPSTAVTMAIRAGEREALPALELRVLLEQRLDDLHRLGIGRRSGMFPL